MFLDSKKCINIYPILLNLKSQMTSLLEFSKKLSHQSPKATLLNMAKLSKSIYHLCQNLLTSRHLSLKMI